jgi:Arc/MetJ-type ribon-helix-helix transcriptional regulator
MGARTSRWFVCAKLANVWQSCAGRERRDATGYRSDMSKRIAVRLSDELVAFVDEMVASGAARSRAAVVSQALSRERRRVTALRDAEIFARTGPDPELEGMAEHLVGTLANGPARSRTEI